MNSPVAWIGVALVVVGGLWFAQGVGWIGGSPMTGVALWAIIGPLVALAGVGLVVRAVRARG